MTFQFSIQTKLQIFQPHTITYLLLLIVVNGIFSKGSGAVIEGGLVLTAAHVIANYTYIELEKTTTIQKCSAKYTSRTCKLVIVMKAKFSFSNQTFLIFVIITTQSCWNL
jgi:3-oxoacyl-ACP reductase-like protein